MMKLAFSMVLIADDTITGKIDSRVKRAQKRERAGRHEGNRTYRMKNE